MEPETQSAAPTPALAGVTHPEGADIASRTLVTSKAPPLGAPMAQPVKMEPKPISAIANLIIPAEEPKGVVERIEALERKVAHFFDELGQHFSELIGQHREDIENIKTDIAEIKAAPAIAADVSHEPPAPTVQEETQQSGEGQNNGQDPNSDQDQHGA